MVYYTHTFTGNVSNEWVVLNYLLRVSSLRLKKIMRPGGKSGVKSKSKLKFNNKVKDRVRVHHDNHPSIHNSQLTILFSFLIFSPLLPSIFFPPEPDSKFTKHTTKHVGDIQHK